MRHLRGRVHFIGIGGIGMSGLAEILLTLGYPVSGSDLASSPITERLTSLGADCRRGHEAGHVGDATIVVRSAAVDDTNPEVLAAREAGIPVITRAELLADIMRLKPTAIAVGGTHGKTTTTSFIQGVLEESDPNATAIVGGIVQRKGSNVSWGTGDTLVAEADEHDGSFLKLTPTVAVVTTIDAEHLEYYGTLDAIQRAFIDFINKVPFYGFAAVNGSDANIQGILPELRGHIVTYGLESSVGIQAVDVEMGMESGDEAVFPKGTLRTRFTVENHDARLGETGILGTIEMQTVGRHNVLNALGAVAVGLGLRISFADIAEGLRRHTGVGRRLETKAFSRGVRVVEDYAHHPTEIEATVEALGHYGANRLIVVFQPHLYSRTKFFTDDFGASLQTPDHVIVTEIYGAREKPMPGVSGMQIVEAARKHGQSHVEYIADHATVVDHLYPQLRPGDLVAVLGAGDIYKVCKALADKLESEPLTGGAGEAQLRLLA